MKGQEKKRIREAADRPTATLKDLQEYLFNSFKFNSIYLYGLCLKAIVQKYRNIG